MGLRQGICSLSLLRAQPVQMHAPPYTLLQRVRLLLHMRAAPATDEATLQVLLRRRGIVLAVGLVVAGQLQGLCGFLSLCSRLA